MVKAWNILVKGVPLFITMSLVGLGTSFPSLSALLLTVRLMICPRPEWNPGRSLLWRVSSSKNTPKWPEEYKTTSAETPFWVPHFEALWMCTQAAWWLSGKECAGSSGDPGSIPRFGRSPGEGNGPHSGILAWRIPRTAEPGWRRSTVSRRVRHDQGLTLSLRFQMCTWDPYAYLKDMVAKLYPFPEVSCYYL